MRIGVVIEQFDPLRGGVEQWTNQFAHQLIKYGHEVHVLARRFGAACAVAPVVVHKLDAGRSRLAFAEAAEIRLQSLTLDVIHDTGCGWHCDVFQPHGGSRRASFEQNLLLEPQWLRPWKRRASRWLPRYAQFDRLLQRQYGDPRRVYLALSRMVARDLRRWHGVREEQLRIVYNGVDCQRFSPEHREVHREATREKLGVGGDETLLLIVAHNFALKGVATLIRAVGRLRREGAAIRLTVVGGKRGQSRPYEQLADECGSAAAVQFAGACDDPIPFYAAADAYVQPTFYDPCSLVALEALASGLPVVTSRFNGAGELITPGREGHVLDDPADDCELAELIRPLLDRSRREIMSGAARAKALQHTLERNCREIVKIYDEIARRGRLAA